MKLGIIPDSVVEEKLRTDILNAFTDVVAFYSPTHQYNLAE